MSITKERLNELALEVGRDMDSFIWSEGCGYECGVLESEVIEFAQALLTAVEKELVVEVDICGESYVQLPLIKEN